jgi:hypothetical protein
VRKGVIDGYTWLAYFHALLTDQNIEDLNITAKMSDISGLEDQIKLELLQVQVDLLDKLGSALGNIGVPTHVMVDLVFRRYMRLPDDVINAVITALPNEGPLPGQEESADKADKAIKQMMLTEATTVNRILGLVKMLKSGGKEMQMYVNETTMAAARDRLPTAKAINAQKSLMEAANNASPEAANRILLEWSLSMDGHNVLAGMPQPPTPAVGGAKWRQFIN